MTLSAEELLRAIMDRNDGDNEPPRPLHKAQILEIESRFNDYQNTLNRRTFPFHVGQLVTPRPGCTLRQQGDPHIVLEIRPGAEPSFPSDAERSNSPNFGQRHNMRVLSLGGGDSYCAWWVEAFQFIPYEPPS